MQDLAILLTEVREKKPLVHHLTNWVTIYQCAAVVRAIGALPVMAHAKEEVEEMTGVSSALVLNIGTLTPDFVESMKKAAKKANNSGIPVVLDAVGAGATKLRTDKALELLNETKISIVKGNAAEIGVLAGADATVRGVEAGSMKESAHDVTKTLAKKFGCVAVATGKTDYVSDGKRLLAVENGHTVMGAVVGTGCMAASCIGAFSAVEKDYVLASAAGLACFEIAGEKAAAHSNGPGSFLSALFDELYRMKEEDVRKAARVVSLA